MGAGNEPEMACVLAFLCGSRLRLLGSWTGRDLLCHRLRGVPVLWENSLPGLFFPKIRPRKAAKTMWFVFLPRGQNFTPLKLRVSA